MPCSGSINTIAGSQALAPITPQRKTPARAASTGQCAGAIGTQFGSASALAPTAHMVMAQNTSVTAGSVRLNTRAAIAATA